MAATLQLPAPTAPRSQAPGHVREPHFDLLDSNNAGGSYQWTVTVSMLTHLALIAALAIVPLMMVDDLVPPSTAVRAFFAEPPTIAPPPPPPPPPAPGARLATRPSAPTPPPTADVFRAPVTVPTEIVPEAVDLGSELGVEGGVPGGVEGGIAGGVVGGIVGGVIDTLPPPPVTPVRVGGNIKAPKVLHREAPVYPQLAKEARVHGVVIVEAQVDETGLVREAHVLRGLPLLDGAALDAVRQWRYQPLLLNGQPRPFVLVITVNFSFLGAAK